jgi:hypothetical protein
MLCEACQWRLANGTLSDMVYRGLLVMLTNTKLAIAAKSGQV